MNDLSSLLSLILLTPLVAAAIIWLLGNKQGKVAAGISVLAAGIIMVASLYLLYAQWGGEPYHVAVPWLELAPFRLDLGFYLNGVSALMLFVVSFVGFWIHLFSLGYMADDNRKARFFGGLSIFMFSMLGIVLAENLFMLFIFWELVGYSSYILIGHYLKTKDAASASQKAFIVNRVGDFGFLLGIIITFWTFGTTSLVGLEALHPEASTLIALLLFCGVLGKSAQMPLHVWLPDAMAGPTPISALIHAATMVAAGVFLLARTYFLFTPEALTVVGWVGTITAVCAAFWAFAQNDIKKILAYSTLSQLGYMVAAFGFGTLYGLSQGDAHGAGHHGHAVWYGLGAAMFHLTTHAFFKALLFLGSGSVIHACHHEQDIWKMGGLAKKMPITTITFLLGTLALAGIPYLAGFFSKDAILYVAKEACFPAFIILTITAVMTATYMGRLFYIAFLGKPRSEHAEHAHESPWTMVLPLVVLAVLAVVGGYAAQLPVYAPAVKEFLASAVPHPGASDATLMLIISAVASLGGLGLAFVIWGPKSTEDALAAKAKPLWALSRSKFGFDEAYLWYVNQVQARVAGIMDFLDTFLISGIGTRILPAGVVGGLGMLFRRMHTGNASAYVWWFFGGVILFFALATRGFTYLF
ncbi:MAG: NADH-quinone oxidoreductase subunit L [Verrucomicrobiota bacterium JB022]|nr:NADH-quinone oxidoreductase subunit L [Verrucomicrobiota bacterium JB022]